MTKLIDLSGRSFYRLIVLHRSRSLNKYGKAMWVCRCRCGKNLTVASSDLISSHTKSCGCLRNEKISNLRKTHADSKSPEYKAWCKIKSRCLNPKDAGYSRYGGRGITICSRWKNSYENFLADMGRRPGPELTIERVMNGGNYSPENCVWATRKTQANNRRTNVLISFNGTTKNIFQWAETVGIKPKTLWKRLKDKWTIEKALTTPVKNAFF